MGNRLERAEHEREQLQKQVQQLSLALEKTEVQRDTHCAHADLLLKEKNRYRCNLLFWSLVRPAVEGKKQVPMLFVVVVNHNFLNHPGRQDNQARALLYLHP
jgi:hypothetical protein